MWELVGEQRQAAMVLLAVLIAQTEAVDDELASFRDLGAAGGQDDWTACGRALRLVTVCLPDDGVGEISDRLGRSVARAGSAGALASAPSEARRTEDPCVDGSGPSQIEPGGSCALAGIARCWCV